jgi:hypothetical protein
VTGYKLRVPEVRASAEFSSAYTFACAFDVEEGSALSLTRMGHFHLDVEL